MEGSENEKKEAALTLQIAIRCAKAAMLLSALKCSPSSSSSPVSANHSENEESEKNLRRKAMDLRMKLVKERLKNRKMKLCSMTELLLQIALLLSLWTLCFILAFYFL